jgi:Tfp pilus assembly protein PilE
MSDAHGHDAWHQHTAAEGMPQHEHGAHASAKALGLTFIVMVVGVILVILVLIAYFNSYVSGFKARQQEGTAVMAPAFNEKLAARERLNSHGWIDRDAGTVHIPVPQAIDAVVNEYRQNGPQARETAGSDVQG